MKKFLSSYARIIEENSLLQIATTIHPVISLILLLVDIYTLIHWGRTSL